MAERRAGSDGHSIATVAKLTGLDPHTIRAWERRYGAVRPRRTPGGTRRYGDAEVARLQLLKALTDSGEPIRVAASLSDPALRARLAKLAGLRVPGGARDAAAGRVGLGVLHPALAAELGAGVAPRGSLELRVQADDVATFVDALRLRPCDALVLALDRLGDDPAAALEACREACRPALVVVIYTFARRSTLSRLTGRGARLLRGPLRVEPLCRSILDLLVIERARRPRPAPRRAAAASPVDAPPARRFSGEQLARLAEIASAVDCECPNHLASLVSSLLAFEAYARGCERRDAADAALHAHLARETGRARAQLEDLLGELCERDGIAV